jgi:hypothetical protein
MQFEKMIKIDYKEDKISIYFIRLKAYNISTVKGTTPEQKEKEL